METLKMVMDALRVIHQLFKLKKTRWGSVSNFYDIYIDKKPIFILAIFTMARPKRINLAGCAYHVISRAEQNNVVFTEDKDKELFLEYLTDYTEQFDMRLHAYCLMDTHFHSNRERELDILL